MKIKIGAPLPPESKRQKRKRLQAEAFKKQLEIAWQYPFCKRCRAKLDKAWAKELKGKGHMPLCKECYGPMMKQFEKLQGLWAKFSQR